MKSVLTRLGGTSLMARVMRSSALTVGGFGASQLLRLASNLILTRILFPEAFGMMALIMIFIQGLVQFSDAGVTPAIMQSKRGDDPNFLNTAWTIQVIRGFGLWIMACVLAWPIAQIYGEPMIVQYLPVAALSLIVSGFDPTKVDTANRHLNLGRTTAIDLSTQVIGTIVTITLAWMLQSVWALVIAGVLSAGVQLFLFRSFLPGPNNSFHWEKEAVSELVNFGKWIFLSTIAGFVFIQADKILFGKFLTLDAFGVYNIGFFLASFPLMLGYMVTGKILIPVYRELPPKQSPQNFAKLRKLRCAVTAALLLALGVFACLGVWLVGIMYDDRYALAGPIVVLIACMQIPQTIVLTYDHAALAEGDSRNFFVLSAARAIITISVLFVGFQIAGLMGGIIARGVSVVLVYPFVVWLARRTGAWDLLHDIGFFLFGTLIGSVAIWLHWDLVIGLSLVGN